MPPLAGRPRYRIVVLRTAAKSILRLPRHVQPTLRAAIGGLATDPRPTGCRKLTAAADLYRIRVGEHRVLYEIRDDQLIVQVVKIGHRRDVYR